MTDLLDLIEEAEQERRLEAPSPCLFGSPARGIPARKAELEAWRASHGNFASTPRSHAWHLALTHPGRPAGACRPSVLDADLRCGNWRHRESVDGQCCCVGDLLYRGACTACDWEGPVRLDENEATEDAHGHAWPGWRDLPVLAEAAPRGRDGLIDRKGTARWIAECAPLYPAGWIESGGPVKTARGDKRGTRHVPGSTPFGGYDMAAEEAPRG
jgi:hypothetical protein